MGSPATAGFSTKDSRPVIQTVALPGARLAHLVTRWASRPWRWLWACLRRRPLVAPELESMNILFRLQRYGVVMPRLLAAGQKHFRPWQTQSFLLIEPLTGAVPLPQFLAQGDTALRRAAVRRAGEVVRQMHHASCYLEDEARHRIGGLLAARGANPAGLTIALATVHGITKSHYVNPARAQRDLAALAGCLAGSCTHIDLMRGLLAYLGQRRLTVAGKQFARKVLRRLPAPPRPRRVAA